MKVNSAARRSSIVLILSFALFVAAPAHSAGQKEEAAPEFTESVCPTCHSKENVVPIVYGYPSEELMEESKAGKVNLGGCVMHENNPQWLRCVWIPA